MARPEEREVERARRCWQGASWCSGFWDPRSTMKQRADSRFLVDFYASVQRPLAGRIHDANGTKPSPEPTVHRPAHHSSSRTTAQRAPQGARGVVAREHGDTLTQPEAQTPAPSHSLSLRSWGFKKLLEIRKVREQTVPQPVDLTLRERSATPTPSGVRHGCGRAVLHPRLC
jgi:hypothetical protein